MPVDGVGNREVAGLLGNLRQEHRLVEEVAELFAQAVEVLAIERVEQLVGLFEHERPQRLQRLLAVPWTAARRAQRPHDADQVVERGARGSGHRVVGAMLPFEIRRDRPAPSAADARVSFVAFLYSLAGTAAVHFGDVRRSGHAGRSARRTSSRPAHVIDVLAMLEQKTQGNLTSEERQFLEQVLYELRMRFVAVKGAGA